MEGTALENLKYFNYKSISEGLYNQFCGNKVECEEMPEMYKSSRQAELDS